MRLGRVCCALVLLALSVLIPFTKGVDAIPFSILPNGDLVIETTYTTQGILTCPRGGCSGSGTNSIVFRSGTETAALTFFGADATVPVIGGNKTHVSLGVFAASTTDGFTYPPQSQVVQFGFTLDQSSPVAATAHVLWGFGLHGGRTLLTLEGQSYVQLPIGPQPPPFHYGALVYSLDPVSFPLALPRNGAVEMGAELGAIPEPTTLLLVGTTMAGIGLARWRRRRQS